MDFETVMVLGLTRVHDDADIGDLLDALRLLPCVGDDSSPVVWLTDNVGHYALQARRVARETGRDDVTALPYGINTVSLFAYVFLVMMPVSPIRLSNTTMMKEVPFRVVLYTQAIRYLF